MITPFDLLFTIQFAGKKRCLLCIRIDGQIGKQFTQKGFATETLSGGLCSINTMNEFCKADCRKSSFLITRCFDDLLD